MITVTEHALTALGFRTDSALGAVQTTRDRVYEGAEPSAGNAIVLINKLLGTNLLYDDVIPSGLDDKLTGDYALMVAQGVAEHVVKNIGQPVDEAEVLAGAKARVAKLMAAPQHKWMFAKPEATSSSGPTTSVAVVKDIDVKVEVKADGKIKKGGREVMAEALYQKRVIDSGQPVTNQEFIQILIKELGMTKGGATTYAYNVDKKMGGKLVKKQRGAK